MLVPALCPGHALALTLPSTGRLPSTLSVISLSADVVRGFIGTMQPSDSSNLPIRLRLLAFPNRPGTAVAAAGGWRSPKFRRDPFVRDVAIDPGRASAPRVTVPHMLPSTLMTGSASATLWISRLNPTPQRIAVYASQSPSPTTTQHSLPGGPLWPYPCRSFTGWNAPASPDAP